MSSEEEKSRWDAWKRWGSSSEEEESPDEQREVWKAYRRAFFGEEKSPDEPMTWEAYRTAFRKAWPTFSDAIQATGTAAGAVLDLYSGALEVGQIRELEQVRDEAEAIDRFPEEERGFSLAMAMFEWLRKANTTLDKVLREQIQARVEAEKGREEQRKARGDERNRYWLALGVAILIALVGWVIALGFIQWSPGG